MDGPAQLLLKVPRWIVQLATGFALVALVGVTLGQLKAFAELPSLSFVRPAAFATVNITSRGGASAFEAAVGARATLAVCCSHADATGNSTVGSMLASSQEADAADSVSLDTNVLIRGIEGGDGQALDAALAGRSPIVSPQARAEFLAKGDPQALSDFLASRGGTISAPADQSVVEALQAQAASMGRSLSAEDASIVACAQACGTSLMTGDQQLINFLRAAGLPVEAFP